MPVVNINKYNLTALWLTKTFSRTIGSHCSNLEPTLVRADNIEVLVGRGNRIKLPHKTRG